MRKTLSIITAIILVVSIALTFAGCKGDGTTDPTVAPVNQDFRLIYEEIILDDISTGASNDIQRATSIARNMVTRYGMSEKLGTVLYGSEHSDDAVFLGRDFSSGQNYSEKTAADIDDEIRKIIKKSK